MGKIYTINAKSEYTGIYPHELLPHEEAVIDWELRKSRLEVIKSARHPGSIICASIQSLTEALIDPELFSGTNSR